MIKLCDARELNCKAAGKVQMQIAVNFCGKLRSYCCAECANDDIGECSDGRDNLEKAVRDGDVFILDIGSRVNF